MDILNSPIFEEIKKIRQSSPSPIFYRYIVEVNTPDKTLTNFQLTLLDIERDYAHKYGDVTIITLRMSPLVYYRDVFANREQLKITLRQEPLTEKTTEEDFENEVIERTYQGLLIDASDEEIETYRSNVADEKELQYAPPEEYRIQLVHQSVNILRLKTIGGIYRDMRTDDLVQGLLSAATVNVDVDQDQLLEGVDIIEGDNTTVRDHIVIPHGTPLMEIPAWMQKYCGVYKTGIAHYIQDKIWYVFPRFNTQRFETVDDRLTVVNIPENRMPGIERTYYHEEDGSIIVLATGETVHTDSSEKIMMEIGHGVRYIDADRIFDKPHEVNENKATIERRKNAREYYVHKRDTLEQNFAPFSPERITSNDYYQRSRYAETLGSYIRLVWENADPRRIYPGMPLRYVYMYDDTVNERHGVLLAAHQISAPEGTSIVEQRYKTSIEMVLFVDHETQSQ